MARILLFNIPFRGHMRPTVALVQELLRRGHEVGYYCTADTANFFAFNQIPLTPYPGTTMSMDEVAAANRVTWKFPNYVLERAEELAPFAIAEVERTKPDLVILDAYAVWGEIAARTTGVPSMTSWTTLVPHGIQVDFGWKFAVGSIVRALRSRGPRKRLRAALVARYGEQAISGTLLPALSDANLIWVTAEFQPSSATLPAGYSFVGASVESFTRPVETWTEPAGDGPLVVVSLGTVNNANVQFFRSVLDAFADFPGRFALVITDAQAREALGAVPPNFTVYARIPQLTALESAAALVGHGGLNGIQESVNYGVPLVLVPQTAEQAVNAALVEERGAGVALRKVPPFGKVTAAELRAGLETVLGDPSYAAKAKALGQANVDAGGWLAAADVIEEHLRALAAR